MQRIKPFKMPFLPNTKLIFSETIGNPNVDVLDVERLANLAHASGIPLFVDNTYAVFVQTFFIWC